MPNWLDHLALWAEHRRRMPDARPLETCVVDLKAPELEPGRLVDRAGLAKIAGIPEDDLPDPRHGRDKLPEPQDHGASGPLWSQPVARDWAEEHRRDHGPGNLLSTTSAFGTPQPRGLVDDHNRLTKVIHVDGEQTEEAAKALAWWPAVVLTGGSNSLFPISALRTTLVEAVLSHLARDAEGDRSTMWLSPLYDDVAKILDWYIQHKPNSTAGLLSAICLKAQERLDLHPATVGSIIRRSLRLHSALGPETVDTLLDMALPPSASSREN